MVHERVVLACVSLLEEIYLLVEDLLQLHVKQLLLFVMNDLLELVVPLAIILCAGSWNVTASNVFHKQVCLVELFWVAAFLNLRLHQRVIVSLFFNGLAAIEPLL